jgi:hypothetical protein
MRFPRFEGLRGRLSYANVIATVALFFALTGVATAGVKYLTANDPIPSSSDLSGTYGNPLIGANKVTGAKVLDNSLTGADIDESSLGTVPRAGTADTAGISAFVSTRDGDASKTVSLPGLLDVTVSCTRFDASATFSNFSPGTFAYRTNPDGSITETPFDFSVFPFDVKDTVIWVSNGTDADQIELGLADGPDALAGGAPCFAAARATPASAAN